MRPLWLSSLLLLLIIPGAEPDAMFRKLPEGFCQGPTEDSRAPVASLKSGSGEQELEHNVGFHLNGLVNPAFVSDSIFVDARVLPVNSTVHYFFDDQPCGTSLAYPFPFRDQRRASGFSLDGVEPGTHHLRAEAVVPNYVELRSDILTLNVVPSIRENFSPSLNAYANQPSAQGESFETILRWTSTPRAELSPVERATRKAVLAMYMNWNIDPSIDRENDRSELLLAMSPQGWSAERGTSEGAPLSLLFSRDAPFYQPIPKLWPRTLLPAGYIRQVQLNTVKAGDGIGFGQSIAKRGDREFTLRSQWHNEHATLRTFSFRMPKEWPDLLPWQTAGDLHMIFVDPGTDSFVSSYKTYVNAKTGGPDAWYASAPTKLGTLGDRGGAIAAGFAELPALLQPGEATDANRPIHHALGGSVARVWAARVFPASAWDTGVQVSVNSCTRTHFTNTGLVPYGGVIQLDPGLDLGQIKLTLPALRILQAIQTYGYYVEDFGCSDFDIYTAISEAEIEPFGGLWGYSGQGPGVQKEIEGVLSNSRLYVVPPLTKKQ